MAKWHGSLDEAGYCCPSTNPYEYPVSIRPTGEGFCLEIRMLGEWHECPFSKTRPSDENIRDAIKYLEQRLLPVSTQTLSQFV